MLRFSLLAVVLMSVGSCCPATVYNKRKNKRKPTPVSVQRSANTPTCPAEADAPATLPNVKPHHLRLTYWLKHLGKRHNLDEPLLTPAAVRNLNAGISFARKGYYPQLDLLKPVDAKTYAAKVKARMDWVLRKLAKSDYVSATGGALSATQLTTLRNTVPMDSVQPTLHVALGDVALRCFPLVAPIYSKNAETNRVSTRYDRNACSSAHSQEVVQVIKRWPNGMRLARTRYGYGWIASDAPLSPAIPFGKHKALVGVPLLQLIANSVELENGQRMGLRKGILLPPASSKRGVRRVLVATKTGLMRSKPLNETVIRPTARTLTRRRVLTEAWRYLNTPYGLGGVDNGRDCSRFLLDVFESFNIKLPRHSGWQALAGTFSIDVSKATESERLKMIESAADRGVVLLHFPGHIMMYLGRNDAGKPMAIHAFGEYLKPCGQAAETGNQPPNETLLRVKKVTISDLELGRGTSRKAFIERITRVTVIGLTAGSALAGVAELRPAGSIVIHKARNCRDSYKNAIWVSPERPHKDAPMRIIAALSQDPGSVKIALIDPDGKRHLPKLVRLGGPPHGLVAEVNEPKPGRWRVVVGDGDRIIACKRILVGRRRIARRSDPAGPIWRPRRRWSESTENLFSLFIERLFDYPADKNLTWPNLHTLLQDSSRNILYNHRNLAEDPQIRMTPDCADLPVALRTYFAWKMRLPFGFFMCRRARRGRPPKCDLPGSDNNLMSRLELKRHQRKMTASRRELRVFRSFAYKVMAAIHSSSGRTRPHDEDTDLYPVPLTRRALRPGTVFIDPFGHVLMIAKWIPQGIGNNYGMLIGVDAQPDGTIGRRRFWRGSFLFHPDTKAGGSGFKAWRPDYFKKGEVKLDVDDKGTTRSLTRIGHIKTWSNKGLRYTKRFTKFSTQQYRGTQNDFYDTIESLINPLPLDPIIRQVALLDAFGEALSRRVTAVNNGETHMRKVNGLVMKLPKGARIFLSADQAWEAYSTPSRDNRLLISIDSVIGFPDAIKRAPQRFGLGKNTDLNVTIRKVRARLKQELTKRTIHYTRSDGSNWTLTLQQLIDRQTSLEMAYNPNDCVEIRWGAPIGSAERSTCKRHAPAHQRIRMESYRHWFSTRKRPPN